MMLWSDEPGVFICAMKSLHICHTYQFLVQCSWQECIMVVVMHSRVKDKSLQYKVYIKEEDDTVSHISNPPLNFLIFFSTIYYFLPTLGEKIVKLGV